MTRLAAVAGALLAAVTAVAGCSSSSSPASPAAPTGPNAATFTVQGVRDGSVRVAGWTPTAPPADEGGPAAEVPDVATTPGVPLPDEAVPGSDAGGGDEGDSPIRTATAPDGSTAQVDTSTVGEGFMAATGPGFVDLSWTPGKDGVTYVVERDGVRIGTTTGASYRDKGVQPGRSYDYQVSPQLAPHDNGGPGSAGEEDAGAGTFGFVVQTSAANPTR